jgi:hypothetical protein
MYFLLVANLLPGHLLPRRLDQPLQLCQIVRRHCAREEGQESHDTVRFEKRKKTKNNMEINSVLDPDSGSGSRQIVSKKE